MLKSRMPLKCNRPGCCILTAAPQTACLDCKDALVGVARPAVEEQHLADRSVAAAEGEHSGGAVAAPHQVLCPQLLPVVACNGDHADGARGQGQTVRLSVRDRDDGRPGTNRHRCSPSALAQRHSPTSLTCFCQKARQRASSDASYRHVLHTLAAAARSLSSRQLKIWERAWKGSESQPCGPPCCTS